MERMQEIEERLAAIRGEIEAPDADLDALETEINSLKEEKTAIKEKAEKRSALLDDVVKNGAVIRSFKEGDKMEERFGIESKEYRSAWLRALQGKELNEVEKRAYATGDTHTAIPTLVADKFFEKMKKLAPMMSEITLMRVAGNLKFMTEGTRNAAAAHTENTAVSPAADTVLSVSLAGTEFVKVIRISANASNMSVDGFENWLVEMLSGDIARAIDNFVINDSSNGIVAITYTTGTNQILNTATTGYTYGDFMNLIALIPAAYDAEAKFLVNKKILFSKIKAIVDSSGRPIFDPVDKTIAGYPVVVDDYVATTKNEVYLGKWTDIVGNLSQDITVERSTESGFLNNSIDYRAVAVFDSKPAKIDGIARLVSTTTV